MFKCATLWSFISKTLEVLFVSKHLSYEPKSKASAFVWQALRYFLITASFFLIEILAFFLLKPDGNSSLVFGLLWSLSLSCIIFLLPRKAARIAYGILYFAFLLWTLAQAGYFQVFDKMMWLSTIAYAGEGATFIGDVLYYFPLKWWLSMILMIALGVLILKYFPKYTSKKIIPRLPYFICCVIFLFSLSRLPERIFLRDNDIFGTDSDYGQSSSYRAAYNTMFDAHRVYEFAGISQLTTRDIWLNELYPLTPRYRATISQQRQTINDFFAERGEHSDNAMTGMFVGKNVIMVLMESMDDWMITEEDTPTLYRLMDEGINFTNFYTPGYGSARTLNSEFCMNTGIYLPTTGSYVFDYVNNSFKQSIASQLTANGYNAQVFHYNDPDFYSRGAFEPAMGYADYVCYADYLEEDEEDRLLEENLLFDLQEVNDLFFREGPTFNTIITRSAHLSYRYNEDLSQLALQQYPQYKGLYGSEEEDCARVKAKLVDDMFARLLEELEAHGQLENTVIIAMTDHYTYGYKGMADLYAYSGVGSELLLEKTPFFIWSAEKPSMEVDKELNTSDFLPTVLNLLGIDSPYNYLGQDAFDPNYEGYVLFPDGSWIRDGVAYQDEQILMNKEDRLVTLTEIEAMTELSEKYRNVSNLLLTSNYYKK